MKLKSIRLGNINDVDSLASIAKQSFKSGFTKQAFVNEFKENPFCKILILENEEEIIGYLDYWITFDSSTIAEIAILDKYRKLGYASMLMDYMVDDLKKNEVLSSTLEVRKSNVAAINLYKKYDYKEVKVKTAYYEDGEDAIYMVKGVY